MADFFEKNISIVKDTNPDIYRQIQTSEEQKESVNIKSIECIPAKNGSRIISVTAFNGFKINLSSHYDPLLEAETVCNKIMEKPKDALIILLGAGSGYILRSLSDRNLGEREIVWIEYDKRIFRKILSLHDFSEILKTRKLHIILSDDHPEVLKNIMSIRIKSGFKDIEVISNPAEKKINEKYCNHIESALAGIKLSPIKKIIDYRKFAGQNQKILVFDSSYFTVRECIMAFRMLGHSVCKFNFEKKINFIPELVSLILDFKPDFVFTVNHLGFDEEGRLSSLLSSMKIPLAVWYVDSPLYALKESNANISEFCKLFMWEKSYIDPMKQRGFRKVSYLPLAADIHTFKPLPSSSHYKKFASDVSFVGNSMFDAVKKWEKKITDMTHIQNIEEEIINAQLNDHSKPMEEIVNSKITVRLPEASLFFDTAAYLTWKATMRYRHKVVNKGIESGGIVYGDDGWEKVIEKTRIRTNVDYYSELPSVYNFTRINLNCTSYQMNSALNQRVFDCSACNAFLITDRQHDLFELFKKDEFVSYKNPEEILELVDYHLKNETERRKISFKAFNRVRNEHSYEIRMSELISEMKKTFQSKLIRKISSHGNSDRDIEPIPLRNDLYRREEPEVFSKGSKF